jgi:phage-related protein
MARAQSQYIRIYDSAGVSYTRWQSYYAHATVTWNSAQWNYQPFEADGITAGQTGDESGISITLPATSLVMTAVTTALRDARLVELLIYQFDPVLGNLTPQTGQELIAQYNGELVSANGSFTSITMQLGTSLAPVGAQIPPRTFTTALIGKGCRL